MNQAHMGGNITAQGSETRSADATCALTLAQLDDLSKLLSEKVAKFGFTVAQSNAGGLIQRVAGNDHFKHAGIAVDLHSRPVVLCLFAPDWLANRVGAQNLSTLAELFVERVGEVHRAQKRHIDRFERSRQMIDSAIERSSAGMAFVSLKTTPQRVDVNLTGCPLRLEATLSMLNDALEPYMQRIVAWTPREIAHSINLYAQQQRKRLQASAKLKGNGAVLEIDALAESAIAFAGADFVACLKTLLNSCDGEEGLGQGLVLSENADGRVSIYLRAGRVQATIWFSGVGLISGDSFMIDRWFSEEEADALAGRAATTITDHRLLKNVRIASARQRGSTQTLAHLRMPKRLIDAAELVETMPLAA